MSKKKKKKVSEITKYFLACEFKPAGANSLWSVLEPFCFDIKIGYIHGSLGILSYDPPSYALLEIDEDMPPVMGYIFSCTEKTTVELLCRLKGFYNYDSFCMHTKRLVRVYLDETNDVYEDAFAFILGHRVLDFFASIEKVEYGVWDKSDEKQIEFLEKIGNKEKDY